MSLEEREREKKTTKPQLPVFQPEMLLGGFVILALKVLQTEMLFSFYDFWKASDFFWYFMQNQQVYLRKYIWVRLTSGESWQAPIRAKAVSALCADGGTPALP